MAKNQNHVHLQKFIYSVVKQKFILEDNNGLNLFQVCIMKSIQIFYEFFLNNEKFKIWRDYTKGVCTVQKTVDS